MKQTIKCDKLTVKGGEVYCKEKGVLGDVIGYNGNECENCNIRAEHKVRKNTIYGLTIADLYNELEKQIDCNGAKLTDPIMIATIDILAPLKRTEYVNGTLVLFTRKGE